MYRVDKAAVRLENQVAAQAEQLRQLAALERRNVALINLLRREVAELQARVYDLENP